MNKLNFKVLIVIFIFLNACNSSYKEYYQDGEVKIEVESNDNGVFNGFYKEYYNNGNIKMEGRINNDKKEGKFISYYENGNIKQITNHLNDVPDGISEKYFENGKLEARANFKNGLQDGLTKTWYESGQIETSAYFRKNIKQGEYHSFHENGNKQMDALHNLDSTIFYIKYDENGKWITESRSFEVKHKRDTILLGEDFEMNVKLMGPIPEEKVTVTLNIHLYDDPSKFSLPVSFVDIRDNTMSYHFAPKGLGQYEYFGFFIIDSGGENERMFQVPVGTFWVIEEEKSTAMN